MNKRLIATAVGAVLALGLGYGIAACSPADTASYNLSNAADNFEVNRRVVFYDGINASYVLTIEGLCSLGNNDDPRQLTVTCKTGPGLFKKHFLGLSDNVTYVVEQLEPMPVNTFRYAVNFMPSTILPDFKPKLGL